MSCQQPWYSKSNLTTRKRNLPKDILLRHVVKWIQTNIYISNHGALLLSAASASWGHISARMSTLRAQTLEYKSLHFTSSSYWRETSGKSRLTQQMSLVRHLPPQRWHEASCWAVAFGNRGRGSKGKKVNLRNLQQKELPETLPQLQTTLGYKQST
jgi:hypothetical protein